MHPSCRVGAQRLQSGFKRSAFMTKEVRFCLNANEAPSLPGTYAIAIEFADKVAVTLSGPDVRRTLSCPTSSEESVRSGLPTEK